MLIDTNDNEQMQQYEMQKKELIEEKVRNGSYSASDIALVRTTDYLPVNGTILPIADVPFVCKVNGVVYEAVDRYYEELGLSRLERKDAVDSLIPLSTHYRSSVHFCLNGKVSSHMQGDFEGRSFVIIEPFSKHEDDKNILSVRGEDTYFKDGLQLSDEAVILVDERCANQVIDSDIDQSRVVFYRGDQTKATECMLVNMGIVPETIGKDYIIESPTSKYISTFVKSKNYPCDKHCYSQNYRSDLEKTAELYEKYDESFYNHLFSKVYGDISTMKNDIKELAALDRYSLIATETIYNVIKSIGIDNYKSIVDEYNNSIQDRIAKGEYPTNNQILMGAPLQLDNAEVVK